MVVGVTEKVLAIALGIILLGGLFIGSIAEESTDSPVKVPTRACSVLPATCEPQSGLVGLETALAAHQEAQLAAFYAAVAEQQRQMAANRGGGSGKCGDDWACFAACTRKWESDRGDKSGNGQHDQGYGAVDPSGNYRGAYQFGAGTWEGAVTRAGYPEYAGTPADQVPSAIQDAAARQLWTERGNQPWGGRC